MNGPQDAQQAREAQDAHEAQDARDAREVHEVRDARLPQEAQDARTAVPTMLLGALLVVLAAVVLAQATRLPSADDGAGPATLMWVVGALLFVVGALTIRTGRRELGGDAARANLPRSDWPRVLALLGLLVVFALALGWVGYVVSATFLFGASAIVLGARRRLRSFAYGWIIAVLVQLVFDTGIGLSLPDGPWGF